MDVAAWLGGLGLERYAQAFRDAEITPEVLPELTDADLRELGLPLGPRKAVLKAIRDLAAPPTPDGSDSPPVAGPERRQLTVVFVDLVGSTALSRRIDPEEMGGVLRAFQDAVAGGIARFDGHVAKFLGDGVLAYFGWPTAHEDAAERAVRAGLGLVAAVGRLATPGGEPLAARVGIATGLVVVGELIGEGSAREEAVVGETPNLAARLQALAEPGAVVIAEGTRRLLGDLFACRALAPTLVKGFAEPVTAYAVLGEGAAEGRFDALHAAGLTPLVGREHELGLLLDRWERAREGEGQVVLLSGEPGIGKSRLVRALRERLAGERHTALGQFCSPYHANTALHPVIGLLERAAGLRREDPPGAQLDKLEATLALAVPDVGEAAPVLADLLGIPPGERYPPLELSPQQKKERTFRALLDQLAGLAAKGPVLALYEDAHWADPSTLELIGRVVEMVQRLPLLAVVTFRPELVPPWGGHGHATALSLGRLGRREGAAVVEQATGGRALPAELLGTILDRTDGVPLFVEELTKTVLESGLLREEAGSYALAGPLPALAIPSTLQDSLMARLDRLAPVREVAQVAACIGRDFSRDLLAAIVGPGDDELAGALGRLVGSGLIFMRGEPPGAGYSFKHALVRDAAYHSLLRSRRQQLHARIAQALEERFPETAAAEPELLARHCAEAGMAERAVRYWRRAAELAVGRSANLEAVAHCEQAEAQLAALPPSPERTRAGYDIQLVKAFALRDGKGYGAPEAERAFLRACELGEELGDRTLLMHAIRGLWGRYYTAARWADAARAAERIREAADGLGDRVAVCVRWQVEGVTRLYCGESRAAGAGLREALRHYPEGDRDAHIRLSGHEMGAWLRFHLAFAEWLTGVPAQALRTSEDDVALARRSGRPFSLAQTLTNVALLRLLARDWEGAERLGAEAHDVGARHGIPDYAASGAALAATAVAAAQRAAPETAAARERIEALRPAGWRCLFPVLLADFGLVLSGTGNADTAVEIAAEALRITRETGELAWEAEALHILGEVKRAAGADRAEVEADLRAALDTARRQGARSFELRAATSLARLWAEAGERARAPDLLAPVRASFTEGFDTPDLRDADALLGALGP